VSSKAKDDRRTQGTLQMIWEHLFQGPIDDAVKKLVNLPNRYSRHAEGLRCMRMLLSFE